MLVQAQVGQPSVSSIQPGTTPTLRLGQLADLVVSELQGRYYENTYRGNVYVSSTAAVGTTIVAANNSPVAAGAAAAYALVNPAGNTFNAAVLKIWASTISGTPGGPLALNVITPPSGITAVTTQTPIKANTLTAAGSTMRVIVQSALTGSILAIMFRPLGGPAAIAAGAGVNHVMEDVGGDIIIPPGGALLVCSTATGTNHVVCIGMAWAELPL